MTTSTEAAEQRSEQRDPIIARAGSYYRNMRYLMAVVLVGMGLWFGYDGFIGWPRENVEFDRLEKERQTAEQQGDRNRASQLLAEQNKMKRHTDWDLGLQKFLCFTLPPLGIAVLIWALYNSRGEYRLEGTTLHVPGHPPVPFENITEIDRRLWDRKGIAHVNYDLGDGRQGRLRLDDFVYQRDATDEIFKRVEEFVDPEARKREEEEAEAGATEQGAPTEQSGQREE
jgi:hypothetical protein